MYTDASEIGLGAVLTQKRSQGIEEVMPLPAELLIPLNQIFCTEKMLCHIMALEKWQHYLEHIMFTVVTDHSAYSSPKTTNRLIRWALQLQKYYFIVEYRKGKLNAEPDALSHHGFTHQHVSCNMYSPQKNVNILPITNELIWEKHTVIKKLCGYFKLWLRTKESTR